MNPALVVMTILGCNDSGADCHYIATVNQRWETVSLCDAVSESQLPSYANRPYPVVIAVCQKPDAKTIADVSATPLIKHKDGVSIGGSMDEPETAAGTVTSAPAAPSMPQKSTATEALPGVTGPQQIAPASGQTASTAATTDNPQASAIGNGVSRRSNTGNLRASTSQAIEPETAATGPAAISEGSKIATDTPQPDADDQSIAREEKSLAGSAIERVRRVLPTTEGVKSAMGKPVRLVDDGYSWVARRFQR